MKCKNCGADIPDTDQFCGKCGWKVEKIKSKKSENRNDTYSKESKKPGYDIMTVMSTVIAFLILTVAASIIFVLVIKQTNGNNADNMNNNVSQGIEADSDNVENNDIQDDTDSEEDTVSNTETPVREQAIGTLTIVSDVNIRDNPNTENSNVIKVAKAGETYEYLGRDEYDNWYIIMLEDGTKGYVFKNYVSAD